MWSLGSRASDETTRLDLREGRTGQEQTVDWLLRQVKSKGVPPKTHNYCIYYY